MRRWCLAGAALAVLLISSAQVSPPFRIRLLDEGSDQGAVGRIDCVGSTIACTRSSNTGTLTVSGVSTHNLLSSTHGDTSTASVVRGDMIIGNSSPAWARLAIGAQGQSPFSDGTDLSYKSISFMGGFVASNFQTSSTTYVNVTGMTTALPANALYAMECFGTFQTDATTTGIGLSINGTGGTGQAAVYSLFWQTTAMNTSGNNTSSTTPFAIRNEVAFDSMTATTSTITAASNLFWKLLGFYYTGTSGTSTFAMRVLSEVGSPATVTIGVGSYCLFTRQV